jgi:hypothetical protein
MNRSINMIVPKQISGSKARTVLARATTTTTTTTKAKKLRV